MTCVRCMMIFYQSFYLWSKSQMKEYKILNALIIDNLVKIELVVSYFGY